MYVVARLSSRPARRVNPLILTRYARFSRTGDRPVDAKDTEQATTASPGAFGESGSSSSRSKSEGASEGNPALFVLPLFRKPAFPGFYQVIQVGDTAVLDFLVSLRKNQQGQYLGGFLTKTQVAASKVRDDADSEQSAKSSSRLRRDAGMVESVAELEEVGTILQVVNLVVYPNIDGGHITVIPHRRVQMKRTVSGVAPSVPLPVVAIEYLEAPSMPKDDEGTKEMEGVIGSINGKLNELLATSVLYKEQHDQVSKFFDRSDPLKLTDLVAGMSSGARADLQAILREQDMLKRLKLVDELVQKDLDLTRVQSKLKTEVEGGMSKDQKREMLMAQMKQIMKELGIERDEKEALVLQFTDAIKDKTVPEEVKKVIDEEIAKLSQLEPSSSEFNVCRSYLEWLTCLPWGQTTQENRDIGKAEKILNEDHYGLEDVKERILEHIAVNFLQESTQGKIMCLVGPPGVGKTSISKSIARALERKFYRFSVGGLSDASEIRGHRRTYVGAMPGKLVQCLKVTQSSNPVILIDEIDKLGKDFRGDPSAALLEVLDPEQNSNYRDHYLDVPMDLSKVLFVCTANELDTIPGPLLDRMEVIRIAGYVFEEKLAIANQYLIPSTMQENGVGEERLSLKDEAVRKMISDYAREAGVRQLRKLLDKVSRKVALSMVRKKEEELPAVVVGSENLTTYIGQPQFLTDRLFGQDMPPGVVMGLAWTNMGGATLFIEARGRLPLENLEISRVTVEGPADEDESRPSEAPVTAPSEMQVTGQLGAVMSESSSISLTYARMFIRELDPQKSFLDQAQIHLNVPEGATPKDGPSAGVTMAVALVSLALEVPVRPDVAMTGELSLMGKVLKVGGIQEKVIAARRENVKTILMPRQNEADFTEIKEYLRAGLTAHFVDHFDDVYRYAFEGTEAPPLPFQPRGLPAKTVVTPADAMPPPLPEIFCLPAMEEMQEANPEMMTCRICLESDTSEGDELLAPCLCCGSAKYVHRSCLDQWRVSGFDPKTVTHCGTCKAKFKLQAPVDAKGAEREVWGEIVKYLAIRIGLFFTVVTALGFLTPWLLGAPDVQILSNVILNHLTVGTLSTFVLAGGWAVLQALWSLNLCGIHPHAWSFDGKDATFILLVIVAIIGAIYLLYQLCKGLWEIAQAGQNVASANLRFRNKEMRQRVVERYPVMNYSEDTLSKCPATCSTENECMSSGHPLASS